MSKFFSLDLSHTSLICVCYVDRPSSAKIHYAVRRLTRKSEGAPIFVALLGDDAANDESIGGATAVSGSFKIVMESIVRATAASPSTSSAADFDMPSVA
jgi:hypothetical protein